VDALVAIAIDWMASETERDQRLHTIGRAWCALVGAGDVDRIQATVEELARRTGEDEWDVYSRMLNVAMVYMHALVSGIASNDPRRCTCGGDADHVSSTRKTQS
jgi:hypothetical protein